MVDATLEQQTTNGAESVVWDLSVFYSGLDDPAINTDAQRVLAMADAFADKYRGRVATLSAAELKALIEEMLAIYDLRGRLQSFASLSFSTDTANPQVGALIQRITELNAQISQKLVFYELEWNAMDAAAAQALMDAPELAEYRFSLESQRRFKPYQLSEIEEQLGMAKNVTGRAAWVRFFTQLSSTMRFDFDGQPLNQSQILVKTRDPDRDVRRRAADAVTAGLKSRIMELTYIFNVLAADKADDDKRRGYESWVASRNVQNLAPTPVVDALVNTVTANYGLVARHYHLKRALLGLDELTDYDRYAPLVIDREERRYAWTEAREIVTQAFGAFSPQMAEVADKFFDQNWIHAAMLPNKRGGAFASPTVPSAHPFVFVNYQGTADNVSTLAHELGHGLHMYLSGQATGWQGLYTPLTTAEMASVFAEMVVFQDLMKREPDPAARLAMLVEKVEATFATVFRQTSMNRFEHAFHTARREQGELTTEQFNTMWLDTQRAVFGDSVTLREDYGYWWSYVPHFLHTPGYVYAYAFGELLVLALYKLYDERGEAFVPQYIDVLKAGGSDYPDRILAKVGVDLNDPGFWQKGIDAIAELVAQEEALAREVFPEKF